MSSKNKHDKKINVINRTTSETLRLGEADQGLRVLPQAASSLSIQTLPPVSRKKIQNSSSSFQITGVSLTRSDFGDDSADDLDESHTDDISRVTDNETPSFSEDSRDTDDHPMFESSSAPTSSLSVPTEPLQPKPKPPDQGAGARFKVVKIPSIAPFSRGRWTCFDYLDNSEQNLNISYVYSEHKFVKQPMDSSSVQPGTSKSAFKTNDSLQMDAVFCENLFIADLSPSYATVQRSSHTNDATMKGYTQGSLTISSDRIGVNDRRNYTEAAHLKPSNYNTHRDISALIPNADNDVSCGSSQKVKDNTNDVLSEIKDALTCTAVASNSASAPNNNNIDRKIEEALDAVKTHLMVAVHKEVDFLKTRVSTLEGRVNELEIENSILRVNYLLFKS